MTDQATPGALGSTEGLGDGGDREETEKYDDGWFWNLLRVRVPFGKHEGCELGDVPTRYIDSEVVKWDRCLFVRQCERAMDALGDAILRMPNPPKFPSSLTMYELMGRQHE